MTNERYIVGTSGVVVECLKVAAARRVGRMSTLSGLSGKPLDYQTKESVLSAVNTGSGSIRTA